MKFRDVFFRKMTLLYVVIMFFLGVSFLINAFNYDELKSEVEDYLSTEPLVVVVSDEKLNNVEYASSIIPIKKTKEGISLLRVDDSLKGNECKINIVFSKNNSIGQEYKPADDTFSCTVTGYTTGIATEILVSQTKYDSYEVDGSAFLATVKNLKDLKKIEKKYVSYVTFRIPDTGDYYEWNERLNYYLYTSIFVGIIIALLIVVIFMNTRGYIKSNTKNTKKKKQESTTKVLVINTLITVIVPLVLSYFAASYIIANLIQNI